QDASFAPGLEVQPELLEMSDAPVVVEAQPERAERTERDQEPRRDRDRGRGRGRGRDERRRDERPGRGEAPEQAARPEQPTERIGPVTERFEPVAEVGTEAAPEVEAATPSRVEDVARAVIERAERDKTGGGERKGRRGRGEVTEET